MLVNTQRLQARLDREGLDGLIAASAENVFYLTGIQPSAMAQTFAVVTRDELTAPLFVTSVGAVDQVLDGFPGIRGVKTYGKFYREVMDGAILDESEQYLLNLVKADASASALDALVSALEEMRLADKRIGLDEGGPIVGLLERLSQRVQGTVKPAAEVLRHARRVKTEEEIRRLRHSAQITERALIACKGILRQGVTEYEVAREFERSIVSQGGVRRILHARFGRNGVAGMAKEGDTRLQKGDTIWFDVGCIYQGYCSDTARVYSLGEPSARMRAYNHAMLLGDRAAIQHARPGMKASELFDLTVQAVREGGVPNYRRTHVGHGIGLEVYDTPLIAPSDPMPLEEGMVINIETPYYEFGFGAAHVEDTFVVHAGGNELLTELPPELQVIE